jgi:hypothetical protein
MVGILRPKYRISGSVKSKVYTNVWMGNKNSKNAWWRNLKIVQVIWTEAFLTPVPSFHSYVEEYSTEFTLNISHDLH